MFNRMEGGGGGPGGGEEGGGGRQRILCSVSASVLEVGATSHGLDGVVGTVGHRRGSPAHSFLKMHRIP